MSESDPPPKSNPLQSAISAVDKYHQVHPEATSFTINRRFTIPETESIVTAHTRLPPDHPFYALVGRVASEWSHLEHILDETIWSLLQAQRELIACVTSQILGVGQRCNAIDLLARTRGIGDEFRKPFRQLKQDSFSVGDWRNRIVHDAWLFEIISGKPAQFRAMPTVDPRFGAQEISEEEISETLGKIHSLQSRAIEASFKLSVELSSLLEKQASAPP